MLAVGFSKVCSFTLRIYQRRYTGDVKLIQWSYLTQTKQIQDL